MKEGKRDRETERQTESDRKRERECVCVCVCTHNGLCFDAENKRRQLLNLKTQRKLMRY